MNSIIQNNYNNFRLALHHLLCCKISNQAHKHAIATIKNEYSKTKQKLLDQTSLEQKIIILSQTQNNAQIANSLHIPISKIVYYKLKNRLPSDYIIHEYSMVIFYQINRLGSESFTPTKPVEQMSEHQMLKFIEQTLAVINQHTAYPDGCKDLINGSPYSVLRDTTKMQYQNRSNQKVIKNIDIELHDVLSASGPYTLGFADDNAYESIHELTKYIDEYCISQYSWKDIHVQDEY